MDSPPPPTPEPARVSELAARRRRRPQRSQDDPPRWSPNAHDLHLAIEVEDALVYLATEALRVTPVEHHARLLEVIEEPSAARCPPSSPTPVRRLRCGERER